MRAPANSRPVRESRRRSFAAQDFIHHRAASRALAFDGFAPVLGRYFHPVNDFLLGFAFDTISFGHKKWAARRDMRRSSYGG